MNLESELEALLFVADCPASLDTLAEVLQQPEHVVAKALEDYGARLAQGSALQLIRVAGGYQLTTHPRHADVVTRFLKPQKSSLGKSQMETLAVVAYNQPITMAEIDHIRGAQSDYSLKQLLEKRLIKEAGRRPTPGRPILYKTTQQFLHIFQMNTLSDLPVLPSEAGEVGTGAQPALPEMAESHAASESEVT